ncbi:hypothetical protein NEMBOFW57_008542 [Staphylotrichum longicolle]|uniref:Uncharacterized protein n=1 Tax=Staphylotrichum longicolle TaxID=669026 RepID=A0AAD4ERV3_9PEZI|nr:hypothetical protein NEMBOFW57_008542 [Staphylotrichum longicolle]
MSGQDDSPGGALDWFPWGRQDLPGWKFDVITLLAIIGESSVAEHAQILTASSLCLLPRIIPAPQALLRPTRPQRLPEVTAKMAGVYGGVVLDTVGFFANIMHPLDDLKPFAFKVLEIKHTHLTGKRPVVVRGAKTGLMGRLAGLRVLLKKTVRTRSKSSEERVNDILTYPTMVNSEDRYTVPPAYYSPHHLLSLFSTLLTFAIIAAAALWSDGTAILAISLISLSGTIVCYASWWRPILMNRRTTNKVPRGDVVIRTREGAFVLIRCTEEVARELYSGTEECRYVSTAYYRVFMGLGMVLLMVSVVLLGNCTWNSQVFIGGSYITLNGLYWVLGLLPQRYFWDLGRYEVRDVTPDDARRADEETDPDDPREGTPSFTRTLWYAVRETKHGAWVERSGAMPGTPQWKEWLEEAVRAAWKDDRKWEAVKRKNEIMKDALDGSSPTSLKHPVDEAEQRAPLLEVQTPRRRDGQGQGSSTF